MKNFTRNCPICDKKINYSTKYSLLTAKKNNSSCKSCVMKGKNNPMYGKTGDKNPFFNKKHKEESKIKMIKNRNMSAYKTKEFKKKISDLNSGDKNPMFGKSFYDIWLKKYGKEIADEKLKKHKMKQSLNSSGEKNPMFGKPSPMGSGNGWSGWYKEWFFRSLMELSYMINIIEKYDISWCSGENKDFKIEYIHKNKKRNYFPDFVLNGKYVVEVKPRRLWNSELVISKIKSAEVFCMKNNLIYKMRSIPKLTFEEIKLLFENKQIIFTERYERKFLKFMNKS